MIQTLPDQQTIETTKQALEQNGFTVQVAANKAEALKIVSALIPSGARVMTMTSVTLEETGIAKHLNESGQYASARQLMKEMSSETQKTEMKILANLPEYTIGSVAAITQDGKVFSASNTGSQMAAYVYGADHVIWVIGIQKVVKDMDAAIQRIYEVALPLESERAHKAYGVPGSAVNKILIFNKELQKGRITIVLVKEALGF